MWHRAVFNVPSDTPRERVLEKGPDFAKIFLKAREEDGWRLTSRVWLDPLPKPVENEPDRLEYTVWAEFDRKPITRILEIPENPKLIEILGRKYGARIS
jgi:hypothetical protein